MARIGIDASILLHGQRAGLRHTRILLQHLLKLYANDSWELFYVDRKGNTPGRISLPFDGAAREVVSRIPMRLLLTPWRVLSLPAVENWLGAIDVFYAPDLYFPPTRQAPVLCTIRGVAYLAIPRLCDPFKVRALCKAFDYARRHADHFLAVSESTRQDLLRFTDIQPDRIHVVTHGVDPVFRRLDRDGCREWVHRHFGVERRFFLYVGAIGRHKNIMGLLRVFLETGMRSYGIDLVMAGPFESEIERARLLVAQSGLEKMVHFIGPVDQANDILVKLYNAAIALVHPSFYEGWCVTPLEAMACGTPVIAADISSIREVVADAAVLVPPDEIDAWKPAMLRVVEDEIYRSNLAEKGSKHVGQHTWKRAAHRLRKVLDCAQEALK
jgi:glycosyltransferase involved in cell wall biosynthesis